MRGWIHSYFLLGKINSVTSRLMSATQCPAGLGVVNQLHNCVRENCVLPPAGCLSSPVIIHASAPRMPCVITNQVWAQPKGTELHLVKARETEKWISFGSWLKGPLGPTQHHITGCIIWFGCFRAHLNLRTFLYFELSVQKVILIQY